MAWGGVGLQPVLHPLAQDRASKVVLYTVVAGPGASQSTCAGTIPDAPPTAVSNPSVEESAEYRSGDARGYQSMHALDIDAGTACCAPAYTWQVPTLRSLSKPLIAVEICLCEHFCDQPPLQSFSELLLRSREDRAMHT